MSIDDERKNRRRKARKLALPVRGDHHWLTTHRTPSHPYRMHCPALFGERTRYRCLISRDAERQVPSEQVAGAHARRIASHRARSSVHYDATIEFYRDLVGLPIIDQFQSSYGEDGTIFGLPGSPTHLEIVRSREAGSSSDPFDQLVFYLQDEAAVSDATKKLLANGVRPVRDQHRYWEHNGGTTFRDPDGRGVVYASWVYGRDPQPSE